MHSEESPVVVPAAEPAVVSLDVPAEVPAVGAGVVPPKSPTPTLVRISPVQPLENTSRMINKATRAGIRDFTLSHHPVGSVGDLILRFY